MGGGKYQTNKLWIFQYEEFFLGLFKEKSDEILGWEIMRKDNTINRLDQNKSLLKILNLQKIPFPDLPHHKKKEKREREIFPKSQIWEWRTNFKDLVGMIADVFIF